MPIHIQFLEGAEPGKELQVFDDAFERIVIGRDANRCQVVFPEHDTRVGRVHCTFEQQVGRYRLRVNQEDVVLLDGNRVSDNDQLPLDHDCKLQLGNPGPILVVRSWIAGAPTIGKAPQKEVSQQVDTVRRRGRISFWSSLAAIVLLAAALVVGMNHLAEVRKNQDVQRKKQDELAKQQAALAARWQELSEGAAKVKPALMLIGYAGDPRDHNSKSAMATGFLISSSKRLVATNAHVADLLGSSQTLYAYPNGKPDGYEVDNAFYHPGEVRISPEGVRKRSIIPGDGVVDQFSADVAILHLKDDGKGFPQDVREAVLATPQETRDLSTQLVGMYGYPGAQTPFPALGTIFSPDNRDGNINYVSRFNGTPDADFNNNQLVGYTMSTEPGFSGSPVFLKNGHVVAINNSHHKTEGGNVQAYGIRIDCLWELFQTPDVAKLLTPPQGWTPVPAHVDPTVQIAPPSVWEAVSLLQGAQLLDTPGAPSPIQLNFDQKLNICNQAVSKAERFPFVYLTRGRLYGAGSADGNPTAVQVDYLNKAQADFEKALHLGSADAPPLDPKLFEAKLWLCRIDIVKATLPLPRNVRDLSTIIREVDAILNEQSTSLTKRLEALGWRIRARCHWDNPEAAMDLDKAAKTLPQLPENLLLRANYYEEHPGVPVPEDAKKDKAQAGVIPAAIAQAYAALKSAQQWNASHAAGDTSGLDAAKKQALQAVGQTFNQEWNCLDCYANIHAIGGDVTHAVQTALQASQWAPDAAEKFRSEEDVYQFRGSGKRSP
jgi:hypothetical protein